MKNCCGEMWKLLFAGFTLITIGNCSSYDGVGTTEVTRNFRNYENQKHRPGVRILEYTSDEEDYHREDSDEFEGEKLIGKWRHNGDAIEPKWRDGDSLPLVPFNEAREKKIAHHEVTKSLGISRISMKLNDSDENPSSDKNEEMTMETIPVSVEYRLSASSDITDRYDDFTDRDDNFYRRDGTKSSTSIIDASDRRETTEKTKNFLKPPRRDNGFTGNGNNYYELNGDDYQKPRPRKRRPPQNYEFHETREPTYSITWSTEKYTNSVETSTTRKPEVTMEPLKRRRYDGKKNTTKRGDERSNVPRKSENAELRNLLKMQQTEGLSLSELLQRRNLTLDDLLKGKAEILNSLKTNEDQYETDPRTKIFEPQKIYSTTERPKWRTDAVENSNSTFSEFKIPKNAENSTLNQQGDDNDSMTNKNSMEIDSGEKKIEKISAIVRLTKPIILPRSNFFTTEKMITSSTNDNREIFQNDESAINVDKKIDDDEIMEFSDFTMKKKISTTTFYPEETTTSYNKKYNDYDSTLSIENILISTEQNTILPIEKSFINETKTNGVTINNSKDTDIFDIFDYQSDEPREIVTKINHDHKSIIDKSITEISANNQSITDKSSADKSIIAKSMIDKSIIDESILDKSIIDVSILDKSIINESILDKSIIDESILDKSIIDISINDKSIEKSIEKSRIKIDESNEDDSPPKNHKIFLTTSKPYDVVISEIEPEARAEIFELLSGTSSAIDLERLLKSRNMSIEELIELRKRGSSRVHMAEALRHRENGRNMGQEKNVKYTKFETKKSVMSMDTNDDLSDIEIDTTTIETTKKDNTDETVDDISSITDKTIFRTTMTISNSDNSRFYELLKSFDSLPFSIRTNLNVSKRFGDKTEITSLPTDGNGPTVGNEGNSEYSTNVVEIGLVEEIIDDANPNDGNYVENRENRTRKEEKKFSKVRPSIIASGAILGVTIVVFLGIFVVCRTRQKQKYTYRNTFSRAVFQGPAMTARKLSNSSSLNTIMVNVVATSTTKRPERQEFDDDFDENFDPKSDIENDSLDANDSWDTIPDFMK